MERSIWVFGNPDKSEKYGFPSSDDFRHFINVDIFAKHKGRYRFKLVRSADTIVLSRDGEAYGHFDVEARVEPYHTDEEANPGVLAVYLVRTSALYCQPVRLSSLGITGLQFGREITEEKFQEIQKLAGPLQEHMGKFLLPDSTVEQERMLRELKRRLGQSEFRKGLLAAYNRRCAVTDCNAPDALEAAHIDPYINQEPNDPSNGLLLRGDIHTLFDRNLLGIDPNSGAIALVPPLLVTVYAELHSKVINRPENEAHRPNRQALERRWRKFLQETKAIRSEAAV